MSDDGENRLIAERRAKLAQWRADGGAYPNDFRPSHDAGSLQRDYREHDKDALAAEPVPIAVAGRMLAKRVMGKTSFASIQDRTGAIQLYLTRDALPDGVYQQFKGWDLGDVVGATGTLYRTDKGELSVRVGKLKLLSKCLRPLPEKFHGLTDQELIYRRRYVDLIVNERSRKVFRDRARIIRAIRDYMEAPGREFLEVETPMMHHLPGGAAARPFATHHNALDLDLYLRVAPELFLKRLVVGGLERVYEINRNFRNEGVSAKHNPEFTMLEFYWAYATYEDLLELTEDLLRTVVSELTGTTEISYQGQPIDFGAPFKRVSLEQAVLDYNPELSPGSVRDAQALGACARGLGIEPEPGWGWGKLALEIYEKTVEEHLVQPTYVTHHPTEVSPLSRRNDEDPELTDRFELIITGREIANGFSELNDPEDQAERFRAQMEARAAGDAEAMPYDADYVRALEYGLPPTAGEGVGIDRLVMLLTDAPSIRDVLLFPYLKPE